MPIPRMRPNFSSVFIIPPKLLSCFLTKLYPEIERLILVMIRDDLIVTVKKLPFFSRQRRRQNSKYTADISDLNSLEDSAAPT